ncbi:hypothetical protein AVEN_201436-1 [Araneus ventricosus]|uniref:Histone-lysine N-methyltransferase SETMAR n=1 Tax=Araneus ventricosus TaxID=182803 RepID=A0A4Y2UQZ1_ARAVE|nr:hypothetical protein AVEN_201436-1 [Araneus ventricosus]
MPYPSAASSFSQVVTAFSNSSSLPERLPPRNSQLKEKMEIARSNTCTINGNRYFETLSKLRRAIQNRRRGMLPGGIVFLLENARPHTAAATQELLDQFGWEIFDHPPYSPNLAPSDFHLLPKLKEFLGGKRFGSAEELENVVSNWPN